MERFMELLQDVIVAIGGGTVAVVGLITVFKNLLIKTTESYIETSYARKIENFKHKLSRAEKAYSILLEREMRFYERLDPLIAELVPLLHDFHYYVDSIDTTNKEENTRAYLKLVMRYGELIITLKNETLLHHAYIPESINTCSTSLIKTMQDLFPFWKLNADLLIEDSIDIVDKELICESKNKILLEVARLETLIKEHLTYLCNQK